jgi:hypothetical protein
MTISDLQRPELRNRDTLEKQLAAEIALGALTSLDAAVEKKHEAALEYGAQLLFDNVRKKISEQSDLPPQVACYLFFDRTPEIRHNILRNNFFQLPEDYQEAFLQDAIARLEAAEETPYHRDASEEYYCKQTVEQILRSAIDGRADILAARLTRVRHITTWRECAPSRRLATLRELPETVCVCYEMQKAKVGEDKQIPTFELALAHPDEAIRVAAVKEVTKMKAGELRSTFNDEAKEAAGYGRYGSGRYGSGYRKGDIKKTVYLAIAEDTSAKVQATLVNGIRHAETLLILADKYAVTNPVVAKKAKQKGEKIQKRTEYTMAYQQRKQSEGTVNG